MGISENWIREIFVRDIFAAPSALHASKSHKTLKY